MRSPELRARDGTELSRHLAWAYGGKTSSVPPCQVEWGLCHGRLTRFGVSWRGCVFRVRRDEVDSSRTVCGRRVNQGAEQSLQRSEFPVKVEAHEGTLQAEKRRLRFAIGVVEKVG